MGYWFLKRDERDYDRGVSYYDLPDELADKDAKTSSDIWRSFKRDEAKLRKERGLHYFDIDQKRWFFPDGQPFPKPVNFGKSLKRAVSNVVAQAKRSVQPEPEPEPAPKVEEEMDDLPF